MTEPTIAQRSPYVLEEQPGEKKWCACGLSATQPFCDGSHRGTGMAPLRVTIEEAGTVAWCGCKHSKNMPYCDGSHRNV